MQTFHNCYETDGRELLEQIATSDELRIHYWTLKMKASSSVWKIKYELLLRKFSRECSARTMMLTTFWDCQRLIYAEFGTDASKMR